VPAAAREEERRAAEARSQGKEEKAERVRVMTTS
jgi:hypothetical protein